MMLQVDPRFERQDFRHCNCHVRHVFGVLLAIDVVLAGAALGLSFATKSYFYLGAPLLNMIALGCGFSAFHFVMPVWMLGFMASKALLIFYCFGTGIVYFLYALGLTRLLNGEHPGDLLYLIKGTCYGIDVHGCNNLKNLFWIFTSFVFDCLVYYCYCIFAGYKAYGYLTAQYRYDESKKLPINYERSLGAVDLGHGASQVNPSSMSQQVHPGHVSLRQ